MAIMVHWAKADIGWPMVLVFGGPCHPVHGQSADRMISACGHRVVHNEHTQHGAVLNVAVASYR
jgi:hypothetical protein